MVAESACGKKQGKSNHPSIIFTNSVTFLDVGVDLFHENVVVAARSRLWRRKRTIEIRLRDSRNLFNSLSISNGSWNSIWTKSWGGAMIL